MKVGTGPAVALLVFGAFAGWVGHHLLQPAPLDPEVRAARLLQQLERLETLPLGGRASHLYVLDEREHPVLHPLPNDGKPIVVWFWSVRCGCVRDCEERIVTLLEDYGDRIHFFAVDSNPDDSAADIHDKRMSMGSPYDVERDVFGTTSRVLGVDASASVAVLDGEHRVRFRGAIDDDLYEPTVSYVHGALDAIFAGKPVVPETAKTYGCRYPAQ
ncbi:MAG: hypothetical protein QNJ90_16075 [Planctomycetota bacterium]|nr:hypothetical protein [Planctomycetota bacterium]